LIFCQSLLHFMSALGSRWSARARGKSGHVRVSQESRSIVAGNARRGNPRDANRDAKAERQWAPQGVACVEIREVQRQKSYLRARSYSGELEAGYLDAGDSF